MVMLALRFDLRNPAFAGVPASDRIRAAIEMAEWADQRGGVSISLSEHHGADDGYLPAPIVVAAAMATRTRNVRIGIAALLAPFYDPLRLAEDLAVLDSISEGRVDLTIAAGYVGTEFEMFDIGLNERARRTTEVVETLRKAWAGKPFDYRGRTVQVTPAPHTPGGPRITLGGSSEGAARRAARIADGFSPSNDLCWEAYRDEMVKLGKPDPGPKVMPSVMVVTVLAEDADKGWDELQPYFLHDMNTYGGWLEAAGMVGPYRTTAPADLKATGGYRVVTPETYIEELRGMGPMAFAFFQPMVGGIPPEKAWESLRLFESEVLPALA
jgi:alkanesulfonate monooxygenase SsuD/methylene tetrahydromethanopterin reductase-like flavin-dependent oxidoreductase (luciferase family)